MIVRAQCGKFVSHGRDIGRAILVLSVNLLLNFQNLRRAITKLLCQVRSSLYLVQWLYTG